MGLIETFEAMLARGRDDALLRFGLASEYFKAERFEETIEHLQAALTHDQEYSAAYKLLGKAQTALGDHGAAMKTFERGIGIAQRRGDAQAVREMRVFLNRLARRS